jgi:hypothetical protein
MAREAKAERETEIAAVKAMTPVERKIYKAGKVAANAKAMKPKKALAAAKRRAKEEFEAANLIYYADVSATGGTPTMMKPVLQVPVIAADAMDVEEAVDQEEEEEGEHDDMDFI